MNKAYRVVFNHATQTWTAVAEFAKSKGKTKSVKLSVVATAIAAAATVGGTAQAATKVELAAVTDIFSYSETDKKRLVLSVAGEPAGASGPDTQNRQETIYIGDGSGNARPGSIRIGMNIRADAATGNNRDLIIGHNTSTGGGGVDALATVVGHSTYGAGPSVAMGYMARADILSAAGAQGAEHGGVSIGAFATVGGNVNGGTAIGSLASSLGSKNVALGVGAGAQVSFIDGKGGSVRFGESYNTEAISVGAYSAARSKGAIAIGDEAITGINLDVFSPAGKAAEDSVALGKRTAALSSFSVAIGSQAQAGVHRDEDIASLQATLAEQNKLIAEFDKQIEEWKAQDIVIEDGRNFAGSPEAHITPQQHDQVNAVLANRERAKIVKERIERELQLVRNAQVVNQTGIRENAIAIGNKTKALGLNDIAIGNTSVVTGFDSIAIGNSNNVTGNTSIAIGSKNTVTGNNSGAFGDPNFVTSDQSYAFGNNNTVNSENTFVLGNSVGQGPRGNLTGNTLANSVYLGTDSEAVGGQLADDRTGSAGISQYTATRGGGNTQTAGTGTYKGTTLVTDFVNSVLNDTGFDLAETKSGFQYATTDGDPAGQQVGEYAGNSAVGVVSVGASGAGTAAGNHRRIVNVAAGLVTSTSTDAVNGSQLYAAMVQASRPISFTGNSNQDTGNDGTEQLLGSNLRIIGATTAAADARDNSKEIRDGEYKAKNIATVVSNGEVQIQFADNPEFKAVDLEDTIVPDSSAMTSGAAPTAPNLLNKAVSLGDVLNTGWNLAVEGKAADLVRPYDTVNFIGEGVTITEEADSTTSRTNIKFKVDPIQTGTFAPAPTTAEDISNGGNLAAGDNPTAPATVQGVVDAVNGSFWKILSANGDAEAAPVGDSAVNPSNNVTFRGVGAIEVVEGTGTTDQDYNLNISVKTDNTTIKVNDQGQLEAITKAPETATVTNVAEGQDKAGSVTAPATPEEGAKLVTAQTLADAINNSGFTLKASAAEGTEDGSTVEQDLIKAGETVEMIAGKNLNVKQEADGKVTYSTKENVEFTEIKVAAPNNIATNPITIGTNPEGKNVISGLDTRIPEAVTKTDPATKPAGDELKNAATLGDVLNAAWNLQRDGQDVDAVTPYNTVNHTSFKQGEAVAQGIEITHDTDGDVSNIRYAVKVDNTTTRINDKGEVEAIQPVAGTFKADENGSLAPTDAAEGNKLASVQGVADAVNASYWNINTSQDGANKAAVGDGKVNPSNNVVINGTGAVEVKAGTSTDSEYVIDVAVKTDNTTIKVNDQGQLEAIAPATATMAAAPTADLTAPTAGTILAGDNPTALTTAQNVADMINAAAWKATSAATAAGENTGTSVELVQAGDTVTFEADSGVKIAQAGEKFTFSVKTDNTTTRINDKGEIEAIAPATTALTNADNKVAVPQGDEANKLATAGDIANAINNSGFTLKHSVTDGEDKGGAEEVINPGDVVDMVAGKNLSVQQEANGRIIYATKDKVEFTEVKVGGDVANNPITIGTNPAGENVISGLSNTLAPLNVNPAETKAPTFDDAKLGSAATLSDVLNAGWNLQNNGEAKDFVKAYDTVNFVDGAGTKAVVDVKADGTIADVKYDVQVDDTTVKIVDGKLTAVQPATSVDGTQVGGDTNFGDSDTIDATTNEAGDIVFNAKTTDLTPATGDKEGSIEAPTEEAGKQLVNATTVANAINNSGWKATSSATAGENTGSTVELINPSETVTFDADSGIKIAQDANKFSFSVKTDGTTTRINDKGEVEAIAPATAQIAPNTDGSVTGPVNNPALQDALTAAQDELAALPDTATEEEKKAAQDKVDAAQNAINNAPNALATAQNVADAINASGFTLKTGAQESGKNATPDASELINPSDTVTMIAGDNLVVAQEGGNVVYSLNPDININSAKIGGVPNPADAANPTKAPITIGTVDENGTPKNVIAGLDSTLPETVNGAAPTTSQAAPTLAPADLTKAATVGDVLNAGWNLKANNADVDFVKPYDTVNFVDGKGTKVVTSTDSETSNVQIDVDVTQLSAPITNNADGSVTGPANSTELADAVKAAEDALAALPADATPEEKAAAEKAVQDAKDAVTNAGNALATAQNVADAINASGWNATSGKVGTGEVEGTTNELINPSETVTFQAGDNMMLKQEGNVFTYSVNPNPVFNNVTANQVTVGGTPATQDAPAKAPIVIGTNPEGVNEITGLDTTLPVPAAEQAKPADINESKAATLGDVLNAGWNLKNNGEAKDVVTPYDTVDFVDGNGTKVSIDTVDGVSTVKVDIDTASLTTPVTANSDGTVNRPAEPNKLATAGEIRNAINNSGWKATSGQAGSGLAFGTTEELINPGETVTFKAGNNMVLLQEGNNFTYSVNNNPEFNSVKVGGNAANNNSPITIGTAPNGDNFIDGLTTTLAQPTTEVSPATKPAADKLDNAATLGDVLNAAWNLKNNGEAKDAVSAFDTVDFINGQGTEVSIESDGTVSKVKVDVKVDGTTVKFDENGNLTAVQPDTLVNGNKVGGNINLVDSDTVSVVPGDNPGDIKFNVNTGASEVAADGKAAPKAGDENKVATVGDIVNTINGVGFNAKVAQTGTGVAEDKGGDALVNAGDTVTITAGDNIKVTKEGLNYTVETKKDVTFNSVTANQAIFGGSPATEDAPAKAPIIIGTTPAGKNVVSGLDTTIAAPTTANNPADKPTAAQQENAATLGDVLNAGWNLQENGTAKDVVTPYDTVNFANGNATTVNITTDGATSVVKVDVATDNTTVEIKDGKIAAKTSPITNAADGSVNAPANPAALATAGDVADAINGSGFTLTAQGANGSVVNPGETVDMKNADGNISITKDAANNDVVYNLNPTINVTNVNATGNVAAGSVSINGAATQGSPAPTVTLTTVAGNNLAADGNSAGSYAVTPNALSVATNGNPNQITGVANGAIRPGSTDAVNGGQLYALGANLNNRIDDLDDNYRAGLAGGAALVNIPQVTRPGANLVGVGVGHFKGESAIAVGFSSASDNERLIFKISGSANTQGDYSIGSGMGWQW